eukprot:CAMPEP_0197879142 /NCGR_PEP_ID=MMETSP1439-20131203/7331_1 /TAXON_ID=66791 /ORGANISM="Gonyaulax spinifera, Strain CCMP409" /LENGTH=390 /DNA_ID=CAMNT_0043498629 /DNA_START=53 /DNA_END=1226 /DNA_ORIENTATION=-
MASLLPEDNTFHQVMPHVCQQQDRPSTTGKPSKGILCSLSRVAPFLRRRPKIHDAAAAIPVQKDEKSTNRSTSRGSHGRASPVGGQALLERVAFESAWRNFELDCQARQSRIGQESSFHGQARDTSSNGQKRPAVRVELKERDTSIQVQNFGTINEELKQDSRACPSGNVVRVRQQGFSSAPSAVGHSVSMCKEDITDAVAAREAVRQREMIYSAFEDCGVTVIRASDIYDDTFSVTIPKESAGIVISTEFPLRSAARTLVRQILNKKLPIPLIVLELRAPNDRESSSTPVFAQESAWLLRQGVDEVVRQPATSRGLREMVESWIVQGLVRKGLAIEGGEATSRPAAEWTLLAGPSRGVLLDRAPASRAGPADQSCGPFEPAVTTVPGRW